MIAMYIIFLGIIPGILLVLFLVYYSRHNVPFCWKKPRKSYVQILLCNCSNIKNRTINLFRRNVKQEKYKVEIKNTPLVRKPMIAKIVKTVESEKFKKPIRKINKDDIQIACGEVKVKPPVKPKPVLENKPNVVVVKGLASTTNEMLSKQRLYSVGDRSGV